VHVALLASLLSFQQIHGYKHVHMCRLVATHKIIIRKVPQTSNTLQGLRVVPPPPLHPILPLVPVPPSRQPITRKVAVGVVVHLQGGEKLLLWAFELSHDLRHSWDHAGIVKSVEAQETIAKHNSALLQ
jgi:hypothetical protein